MQTTDEELTWTFPDVNYVTGDGANGYTVDSITIRNNERIAELEETILVKDAEMNRLKNELVEINEEYKKNCEILNKLYFDLNSRIPSLNSELMASITAIIKSITKKIIHKELDEDKNCLLNILENLREHINKDLETTVEVSQVDYEILRTVTLSAHIKLKVNKDLSRGDIVLTNNQNCYLHSIGDTIDKLLGNEHEQKHV